MILGVALISKTLYRMAPVQLKEQRNKQIPLVKVLWRNHGIEEVTRKIEEEIREKYPDLFLNQSMNFADKIPFKEKRM